MSSSSRFGPWVEPHLLAMTRLAVRLVSVGDADDVVQESLTRAWRRWRTYDQTRGSPRSWLLSIFADQARRHRTRFRPSQVILVDSLGGRPDVDVAAVTDLNRAVQGLSSRQRLAVELHYFVGLPVKECAEAMSCSEGTVKSTLSDARRRLALMLEVKI